MTTKVEIDKHWTVAATGIGLLAIAVLTIRPAQHASQGSAFLGYAAEEARVVEIQLKQPNEPFPSYKPSEVDRLARLPDLVPVPPTPNVSDVCPGAEEAAYGTRLYTRMCVGPDGRVSNVSVERNGAPMCLSEAVELWLSGLVLAPALKSGKPVGMCGYQLDVDFERPPEPPAKPQF